MQPITVSSEPTLEQVRERFLSAEQELQAAAAALRRLQVAAEQLSSAREELGQAAGAIGAIEREVASAAVVLQTGAAELRRGVDSLGQADPARLRADFDAFSVGVRESLSGIERVAAELPKNFATTTERLGSDVGETLQASVAATESSIAALHGVVAERLERVMLELRSAQQANAAERQRLHSELRSDIETEARERQRIRTEMRVLFGAGLVVVIAATLVILAAIT